MRQSRTRAPLAIALAAVPALSVLIAPFAVPVAEGCSGASACAPKEFRPGPTEIADGLPTDAWLAFRLDTSGCGQGGAGAGQARVEVTDAAGAKVPGAPELVSLPVKAGTVEVRWVPSAPFAPSSSYTVAVTGLAGPPWTIPFTTGAGAISAPVVGPPLVTLVRDVEPATVVNTSPTTAPEIHCLRSATWPSCEQRVTYARAVITPRVRIVVSDSVKLPAVEAQFFDVTHEASVDDGAYERYRGEPLVAKTRLCVVTVATRKQGTAKGVRSEPACQGLAGLDLSPIDNCCDAKRVIDQCQPPGGGGTAGERMAPGALGPAALAAFERDCGTYQASSSACRSPTGVGGSGGAGSGTPTSSAAGGCALGLPSSTGRGGLTGLFAAGALAASRARRRSRVDALR